MNIINLKKILASSCRQRILITLSQMKKTNIMQLVRSVNSTYNEVNRNICLLEKEDIVVSFRVGHSRFINLNSENTKTITLLKALTILDNMTKCNKPNHPNFEKHMNAEIVENTTTKDHPHI